MDVSALLTETYARIPPLANRAVEGLDAGQLTTRPGPEANTIGWLIWHAARVQDRHIAELLDTDQVWAHGRWAALFGLEQDQSNTGFGHSPEDVLTVKPAGPEALTGYLEVVDRRTQVYLGQLDTSDLDKIVDRRFHPPVTLGVRLVSVAGDCVQHAGQAAYVRGLLGF